MGSRKPVHPLDGDTIDNQPTNQPNYWCMVCDVHKAVSWLCTVCMRWCVYVSYVSVHTHVL